MVIERDIESDPDTLRPARRGLLSGAEVPSVEIDDLLVSLARAKVITAHRMITGPYQTH